ncbi:DNA-binding transcriptional regulator, MocR family, contains an aminotransferase domain [Desulfotomaculum arcticum]|uniref:DNA-binding transcriptional regulator, MocR family, contains an aminotransferase domain n=1 Tax=Desulfotruncus arcticus DSM 17038 TaxID=1121424 RepID=A0A1I2SS83_9FIRM|nr:PLP-dependent aminotransferase family protein [Desulfotruncus arcticus]SFG55734.1 DNA-binding transcriptional regulator, MocR family, contains an aminotransferase domain [Desulfotomaculum arcticum] [Desulfotruncus arcticus DSM 17038]
MRVIINREADTRVYIQIFEQVRRQILSGELLPGFRLPPERKLAESLGVNRTTVLNAYRELKAEGLVGSRVGKGTIVLSYPDEELNSGNNSSQEPTWNHIFSKYSSNFDSCMVKDLLALASRKDVISFATGIASPETGPIHVLKGIEQELVEQENYRALLHTPTEGFTTLREAVCGLMRGRGVYCQYDEVMLLSGSQQGIDLAARVILDPGDIVVVEEPSFFPAIQAFKTIGARVIGIPIDDKGMRIDVLEQLLQRYRPKLVYTIPTFQNPSGTEMELDRRKRLVELAYKYRVLIVEDDAYGGLCYEGHSLPLLKSMDNDGYVIYLSTFSKNVYPGLRLGWIVAHKKVVKQFAAVKQIMDLHSNSLSQWIIERFITSGSFESHIHKVCREYRVRRDAMYDALSQYAPKDLIWNRPRGGYYIWCKLPEGVSASKLISKAAERKVAFVPGTPFFASGQGDSFIRLNFTFAALKDINEGVKRLCEAMKVLIEHKDNHEIYTDMEINPIV